MANYSTVQYLLRRIEDKNERAAVRVYVELAFEHDPSARDVRSARV